MCKLKWLFMLGLMVFSVTSNGEDSAPSMSGIYLELSLNDDKSGLYDRIVALISSKSGINIQYTAKPMSRAFREFMERKKECLFPVSPRAMQALATKKLSDAVSFSLPFHKVAWHAYYRDPQLVNNSWRKNIESGLRLGVPFYFNEQSMQHYFGFESKHIVPSKTITMMMQQLDKGRSDAVIYAYPLAVVVAKNEGLNPIFFNENDPVLIDEYSFVCHTNEHNKRFIERLNVHIKQLWIDGDITKILQTVYGREVTIPEAITR